MVLLRKLGIHVEADTVPADVAQRFRAAFGGGMSEEKKKVMQILLNGDFDLTGLGLDLEGLEDAALWRLPSPICRFYGFPMLVNHQCFVESRAVAGAAVGVLSRSLVVN
jgi:hypothetical protein